MRPIKAQHNSEKTVRARLAPSPTGALHLGNARTFLIAWLSARSKGGSIVLRMEDLDHPKVKTGAAQQAIDDLRWLGLDWDEGPDVGGTHEPYTQSMRTTHYAAALGKLQRQDMVYPCICSRRDVEEALSAPHSDKETARYQGACSKRFNDFADAQAELPANRIPAWRFRTPNKTVTFTDGFLGEQEQNVHDTIGDFVIARHVDGAGYMLGVVVDDHAMQISEVLRADDLLDATHRQILLYEALELPLPNFIHVPLVVSTDNRRLAKRHGDTRIASLREQGADPKTVVGVLAHWCGWAGFGEQCHPQSLLSRFRMESIPKTPTVLDSKVKQLLGITN